MLSAARQMPDVESPIIRRLMGIDWDFPLTRSESPFSALHWHPCRFPSQVASAAIGLLSARGETVLDPFSGSGTTAVEAQVLGRRSVAVDINPISSLITRAKTLVMRATEAVEVARGLKNDASKALISGGTHAIPPAVQSEKWYSPATLSQLSAIFSTLAGRDGAARAIGLACFSATLMPSCNEDRHWGYVCDNTKPKGRRDVDALKIYIGNIDALMDAYERRDSSLVRRFGDIQQSLLPCDIVEGDIRASGQALSDKEIDCIVTSPPYFGVADYVKSQRLTLEWLGSEIEPIRKSEIGARSKRHRITAREEYISDLTTAFSVAAQRLKPGGYCFTVYGESASRASCLADFLGGLEAIGLRKIAVVERFVSISRRQKPSVLNEYVVLSQRM